MRGGDFAVIGFGDFQLIVDTASSVVNQSRPSLWARRRPARARKRSWE
jgi:hypothetical protein